MAERPLRWARWPRVVMAEVVKYWGNRPRLVAWGFITVGLALSLATEEGSTATSSGIACTPFIPLQAATEQDLAKELNIFR